MQYICVFLGEMHRHMFTVNVFPFYLLVLVQALAKQGFFQHIVEVSTFNHRYVVFLRPKSLKNGNRQVEKCDPPCRFEFPFGAASVATVVRRVLKSPPFDDRKQLKCLMM